MSYDYELDYDDGSEYDHESSPQYWHSPSGNRGRNNEYEFDIDDESEYSYASNTRSPPRNTGKYTSNMYNGGNAAMARTQQYLAHAKAMKTYVYLLVLRFTIILFCVPWFSLIPPHFLCRNPQAAPSWTNMYSNASKANKDIRSPNTDDSSFHSSYVSSSMESPQSPVYPSRSTPGAWRHQRPEHSPAYNYHIPPNKNIHHQQFSPDYDHGSVYSDEFEQSDAGAFSIRDETDSEYLSSSSFQQNRYGATRDPLSNTYSNSQFSMGTEESYSSAQSPKTEAYSTDMESVMSVPQRSNQDTPQQHSNQNDYTGNRQKSILSQTLLSQSPTGGDQARSPANVVSQSFVKDSDLPRHQLGYSIPSLSHLTPGTLVFHSNRQNEKPLAPGTLLSLDRIKGTWTILMETGEILSDIHPASLSLQKDPNSTTFLVPSSPSNAMQSPGHHSKPLNPSLRNSSRLGTSLNRTSILLQGLSPKKPEFGTKKPANVRMHLQDESEGSMVDDVSEDFEEESETASHCESVTSLGRNKANSSALQYPSSKYSDGIDAMSHASSNALAAGDESAKSESTYEESLGDQEMVNIPESPTMQITGVRDKQLSPSRDDNRVISNGRNESTTMQNSSAHIVAAHRSHPPKSNRGFEQTETKEFTLKKAANNSEHSHRQQENQPFSLDKKSSDAQSVLSATSTENFRPRGNDHRGELHQHVSLPPHAFPPTSMPYATCPCPHTHSYHPAYPYAPFPSHMYAHHVYGPPTYPPSVYSPPYDPSSMHHSTLNRIRPPLLATFNPYSASAVPPSIPGNAKSTATPAPLLQHTLPSLKSPHVSPSLQTPPRPSSAQSTRRGGAHGTVTSFSPLSSSNTAMLAQENFPITRKNGPSEAFQKMFGEPISRPHLHPRAAALLEQSRQSVLALDALFSEQLGQAQEILLETRKHLTALGVPNTASTQRYTSAITTI